MGEKSSNSRRPKSKPWSYVAGKKGRNRVRVYERSEHGLWIDYRDATGKRVRQSLGRGGDERDWAEAEADRIAAQFRREGARDQRGVTLRTLFDKYERDKPEKGASKNAHDQRARKLFLACWGGDTPVADLDRRDWDRFIEQRRSGALTPKGSSRPADGVGSRAIQYDLRYVLAVLRWGECVRERGRPLVDRNPFRGFPVPSEPSPRRPIVTEAEFRKLVKVAPRVGTPCRLFLLVVDETGHRGSSVAQLRWSDVDLVSRSVVWRAESDKTRFRHTTPLSSEVVAELKKAQRASGAIGDAWIFPSPTNVTQPVSRHLLRDWWDRLEELAKLEPVKGRGWHSLRRKFATDHEDRPLVELMALGGWRDPQTIIKCYQKPREERLREAVERRATERRKGRTSRGTTEGPEAKATSDTHANWHTQQALG
jgi:integrase